MKLKFKILVFAFILLGIPFVLGQVSNIFEIELEYDNGDLALKNLNVEQSEESINNFGEYSVEIRDFDDLVISIINFDVPNTRSFESLDPNTGKIIGGFIQISNQTEFIVELPYYSNARKIIIYDSNYTEKLTIDVSHFAKDISVKKQITPGTEELEGPKEIVDVKRDYNIYFIIGVILITLLLIITFSRKKK
tara:strand:+ start:270 stop:848 length:579 start_codon:yes stop_codon:yes gene_type:complete